MKPRLDRVDGASMSESGGRRPAPANPAGPRPGTLRWQLLTTALGGLAVGLLLCGVGIHLLLASTLIDRHGERTDAAAGSLALAIASAPSEEWRETLKAATMAHNAAQRTRSGSIGSGGFEVLGISVVDDGELVFESPAGETATQSRLSLSSHRSWAALFEMATLQKPVSIATREVGLPRQSKVALQLRAQSPTMVRELLRLDALVAAGLLVVFAITAPLLTMKIIRLTEPLSALREAVRLARQAGRSDSYTPPPARRVNTELAMLCRVVDTLGADVASARTRLSTANQELTLQVKARTAELSQANRQLEIEAEDKDHFLRAVTHDLNAPLRNIEGLSKLLLSKHADELSEGAASRLERIGINVKHQHELINDLLELSRLRTKAHRPVEVRLGELVDEVAGGLGYDLESSNIAFEMRGSWPVVFAERNRFRQVFQNLIDNAIKYMMDSEERRITVTASRERDFEADVFEGQDVYRFSVADTGRGIAAEDVGSVFRVFSRSIHSGTHDVAGRGVGLACVEAIVRRYGGRVGVESTLGAGSTFWFTVPVANVARDAETDGGNALGSDATEANAPAPRQAA